MFKEKTVIFFFCQNGQSSKPNQCSITNEKCIISRKKINILKWSQNAYKSVFLTFFKFFSSANGPDCLFVSYECMSRAKEGGGTKGTHYFNHFFLRGIAVFSMVTQSFVSNCVVLDSVLPWPARQWRIIFGLSG